MKVRIDVAGPYVDFPNSRDGKVRVKNYEVGDIVDFPQKYFLTLRKNNLVSEVEKQVEVKEEAKPEETNVLIPVDYKPRPKKGKK